VNNGTPIKPVILDPYTVYFSPLLTLFITICAPELGLLDKSNCIKSLIEISF
jgi:hypothetical protein